MNVLITRYTTTIMEDYLDICFILEKKYTIYIVEIINNYEIRNDVFSKLNF